MYVTYFGLDQGYRKGYFEVVVIYWHALIRRTFCHDLDSHNLLRSLSFDTISSTSTWALCSISQCLRWRVNFFKATSQDAAGLNLPFSKDRAWCVVYGQGCHYSTHYFQRKRSPLWITVFAASDKCSALSLHIKGIWFLLSQANCWLKIDLNFWWLFWKWSAWVL